MSASGHFIVETLHRRDSKFMTIESVKRELPNVPRPTRHRVQWRSHSCSMVLANWRGPPRRKPRQRFNRHQWTSLDMPNMSESTSGLWPNMSITLKCILAWSQSPFDQVTLELVPLHLFIGKQSSYPQFASRCRIVCSFCKTRILHPIRKVPTSRHLRRVCFSLLVYREHPTVRTHAHFFSLRTLARQMWSHVWLKGLTICLCASKIIALLVMSLLNVPSIPFPFIFSSPATSLTTPGYRLESDQTPCATPLGSGLIGTSGWSDVTSPSSASTLTASTRRSTFRPETRVSRKSTTRRPPLPRISTNFDSLEHQAAASIRQQAEFPLYRNQAHRGLASRRCWADRVSVAGSTSNKETCADMDRETVFPSLFKSVSKEKRDRDLNVVQTLREREREAKSSQNPWTENRICCERRKTGSAKIIRSLGRRGRSNIGKREFQIFLLVRSIRTDHKDLNEEHESRLHHKHAVQAVSVQETMRSLWKFFHQMKIQDPSTGSKPAKCWVGTTKDVLRTDQKLQKKLYDGSMQERQFQFSLDFKLAGGPKPGSVIATSQMRKTFKQVTRHFMERRAIILPYIGDILHGLCFERGRMLDQWSTCGWRGSCEDDATIRCSCKEIHIIGGGHSMPNATANKRTRRLVSSTQSK